MDDHLFSHTFEVLEAGKTMEKFRTLLRIQLQFGAVLLGVDRQITDDLPVLKRERGKLKRRRQIFIEIQLTHVVEVTVVRTFSDMQGGGERNPFPLAGNMGKFRLRIDLDPRFRRDQHLVQQLGQARKFQSRILGRCVVDSFLFAVLDGIFGMIQRRRHGVRTNPAPERGITVAAAGKRSVRETTQFRTGKKSVGVTADDPQRAGRAFMTAQHLVAANDLFRFLEHLFRGSCDQLRFKTFTHVTYRSCFRCKINCIV